jgi:hypothetical protein
MKNFSHATSSLFKIFFGEYKIPSVAAVAAPICNYFTRRPFVIVMYECDEMSRTATVDADNRR